VKKYLFILFIIPFLFIKNVQAISLYGDCKGAFYPEIEEYVENHKYTLSLRTESKYFAYCVVKGYDSNVVPTQITKAAMGCTFDDIDNYKNGKETACKQYFEIYKAPDSSLQLYTDENSKIPYSFPAYYQYMNVISLDDKEIQNENFNLNKTALLILTIVLVLIIISFIVGW